MYIVTGGAGFIGSCVVRTLNDAGIGDIVIVDNIASTDKCMNLRNKRYLKYINNLKNSKIIVGEVLKIPSYTTKATNSDLKLVKHKVRKGENLNLISKKYNVSVANLKKQNKLRSNNIRVGQVLVIDKKG